jgi:hypothetical protein
MVKRMFRPSQVPQLQYHWWDKHEHTLWAWEHAPLVNWLTAYLASNGNEWKEINWWKFCRFMRDAEPSTMDQSDLIAGKSNMGQSVLNALMGMTNRQADFLIIRHEGKTDYIVIGPALMDIYQHAYEEHKRSERHSGSRRRKIIR